MIKLAVDYLRQTASRFPDKTAIVDGDRQVTFGAFWERVTQLATVLSEDRTADVIAIPIERSIETLLGFAAAQLSGSIYVPLDPTTPPQRRAAMREKLGPHHVLEFADDQFRLDDHPLAPQTINDPSDAALVARLSDRHSTDPLYIMFTSGTTGVPKGVTISNASVINYIEWVNAAYEIDESEVIANGVPLFFDGSVLDVYCAFSRGCTLHLIPHASMRFPADLVQYLQDHEITLTFFVPSAVSPLVQLDQLAETKLPDLRKILFIGEPLPPSTIRYLNQRLPDALISNQYGPTETTVASTYWHAGANVQSLTETPIGSPVSNTTILLLGDDGQVIDSPGVSGEICIGGAGVSLGYWNDPAATAERFIQNPANTRYRELVYRTGDVGYRSDTGLYFTHGRIDDQFKHQGHRIEGGEIEAALGELCGVSQCFCRYDAERRQIVAFVTGDAGVTTSSVRREIASRLPAYMIPHRIVHREQMDLTPNGKIDRRGMWEQWLTSRQAASATA